MDALKSNKPLSKSAEDKHHRATKDKNGLGVATKRPILLSGYP